jgi:phenylacetate-CoA ligase
MIHDAAERLRCAVYAAGPDDTDRQIAAIERFRATAYCGKLGVLRRIVERAAVTGRDISTLKKALVFGGPMSTHFRRECEGRGLRIRQAWVTPEIGVIAYETDAPDGRVNEGMIVNEGVHVEILDPETDGPARPGAVGEVVLTRPSVDFPVLRMRTGDLSRFIREPSPCGRSNIRIQGWMGRVEEMTTWRNVRVLPSHVLDMRARHACCRNMKLFVTGDREAAEIVLRVEGPKDDPQLPVNLRATMQNVLGFEAKIDICDLGALPRDGRLIVDERRAA